MRLAEIEKLVDLVASSQVAGLTVETPGRRLTVRKFPGGAPLVEETGEDGAASTEEAAPAMAEAEQPTTPQTLWINSPMVGIFYPSTPPVEVGATVAVGDVVGLIESMKLMNDVRAEVAGVVQEVVIEPAHAVEYGQPLFALGKDDGGENE